MSAAVLALSAALLHALWNLLLAREHDPEPATAVAIRASVMVFVPVAAVMWEVDPRVWPFIAVTSSCGAGADAGAALVAVGIALLVR